MVSCHMPTFKYSEIISSHRFVHNKIQQLKNVGMCHKGFAVSLSFSLWRIFTKTNKWAAEYKTHLLCFPYSVPVSPGGKVTHLAGLLKQLGHFSLKCMFCHSCFRLRI